MSKVPPATCPRCGSTKVNVCKPRGSLWCEECNGKILPSGRFRPADWSWREHEQKFAVGVPSDGSQEDEELLRNHRLGVRKVGRLDDT